MSYTIKRGSTPRFLTFDPSNNETNCAAAMGTKDDSRFDDSAKIPRSNYRQRALFGSSFFGDENFLVHVCDRGFPAWCFNEDTRMEKGDKGYAHHSQVRMQKRLEERRVQDVKAIAHVSRQQETDVEVTGSGGKDRAFHGDQI